MYAAFDALVGMMMGATMVWGSRPVWRWWKPEKKPVFQDAKDAALAALEACLVEHPDNWEQGKLELVHSSSGVRIWTANQDYALSISGRNWKLEKDEIPSDWRIRIYKATKKEQRAYRSLVNDLTKSFGTPLQIEGPK